MSPSPKRLYVTHYPIGMSARELGSIFESIGPIFECRIPFQKRYAFVEYLETEDAHTAFTTMNGHPLGHSQLLVSWAHPVRNNSNYSQREGTSIHSPEKNTPRYVMPDNNAYEGSTQIDTSASSKVTSLQQSPETSWNGWDTDEKAAHGSSDSGEAQQNYNADWRRIKDYSSDFKPFVTPMKGITRIRSEGDVRMLDNEEKHSMKHSESTPCISKRKRSFDAVRDDSDTEASKRLQQESGWE